MKNYLFIVIGLSLSVVIQAMNDRNSNILCINGNAKTLSLHTSVKLLIALELFPQIENAVRNLTSLKQDELEQLVNNEKTFKREDCSIINLEKYLYQSRCLYRIKNRLAHKDFSYKGLPGTVYDACDVFTPFEARMGDLDALANSIKIVGIMLAHNKLLSLPQEIDQLICLRTIDITDNQLIQLPPEIGKLTKLEQLLISHNQIIEIPETIGNLKNLQVLNASDNQLSSLPKQLSTLPGLKNLNIKNNPLQFCKISGAVSKVLTPDNFQKSESAIIESLKELKHIENLEADDSCLIEFRDINN